MRETPTLHLTVGLPGVGKTALARKIAHEERAVRFTPDEWMIPLFGTTWREADAIGKRDVLEGRLLWAAHEVLSVGGSVVLDFGCWTEAERWAVRAVAEHAGGRFLMHFVDLPEAERRARATARWEADPGSTFELSPDDHGLFAGLFQAPTEAEIAAKQVPSPPKGHRSWLAWAANRWPSLPDFSDDPQAT
ncbi:MAG: AAA family ATPase [Actinomycetota bacterium]